MTQPIGIVSDLHANADALMAVCDDLERRQVKQVWCLGDLMGYGPDVNAVAHYALSHWTCIAGNHDDYFAACAAGRMTPNGLIASKAARRAIATQLRLAGSHAYKLGQELDALPSQLKPHSDVLLIHPEHDGLGMYPSSGIIENREHAQAQHQSLAELHRIPEQRLLVFRGHTHRPAAFIRSSQNSWLTLPPEGVIHLGGMDAWINPGSVGESRVKGDQRAFYAIYHPPPTDTITFVRLGYDVSPVRRACERAELAIRPAWAK